MQLFVALLMIVTMHCYVILRQSIARNEVPTLAEQEPARRERHRRQTVAEIKAAAMARLRAVAHAYRAWALRERLRAQTFQEIEDSSFAVIDTDGVHALTIAAPARSPAVRTSGRAARSP